MISDRNTTPSIGFWRKIFPFLRWWNFIGWDTTSADLMAGLTGAVIVIPQGVAFAMIAGLPPEYGIYTAIVVPLVAAFFGSSLHLISGPTTAISIIVFSSLSPLATPGSVQFIQLALTLTFLAGLFQLSFGIARLGLLVNFVSHSVLVGFTAGAAILIATSQLKHIFGLELPGGISFFLTWVNLFREIHSANPYAATVAVGTFACAAAIKFFKPRWPGLLIGMIVGSILGFLMGAESHGIQMMEGLPANLPHFSMPDMSIQTLRVLAPKAFAIALIGLIEALSIARSIATFSRQQIDGNQEFIGQGLSNIIGSFFSSYAGSGSFTRSGINYNSGAMTPLSAVFSAIFLALILLFMAPLTVYLPIPAMGGVILLVAFNLLDFHHIKNVIRTSKDEAAVLLTSFLATLFLDLEFAIYSGVLMSLVLYLTRTAHPEILDLTHSDQESGQGSNYSGIRHSSFKIIRIDGSLFFGAVNHIMEFLHNIDKKETDKSHILIMGHGINFIDITGAEMLANECRRRRALRGGLYLCGIKKQIRGILDRSGYIQVIGKDNIFSSETEAMTKIFDRIENP
ncbi:MAG: SulP family inorganic anion transporter [Desulfobacula sp.]|jgi:SulP family sulfate permease|nr:SulP family inorganic anion transporter [Desulfobacula sp.]